jgi:phosphate transport system permease protein
MADPSFFEGSYTTLPVQIYDWARRPQEELRTLAAAGILVMLALVLAMNSVAVWLRNRYEQKW